MSTISATEEPTKMDEEQPKALTDGKYMSASIMLRYDVRKLEAWREQKLTELPIFLPQRRPMHRPPKPNKMKVCLNACMPRSSIGERAVLLSFIS
jgi:hypothetical protein